MEDFKLNPVFPNEKEEDSIVKQVRFGGKTIIQEKGGDTDGSISSNSPGQTVSVAGTQILSDQVSEVSDDLVQNVGITSESESVISVSDQGSVDGEMMLSSLSFLKKSLEDHRNEVMTMIGLI